MHACSALDHPHIVQPRALIGTPPCIFIVTEHANGGDLYSFVARAHGGSGLPAPVARFLFQQIMLALDFCVGQSIVVRDLDPRTLLVFWNSMGMPIVKLSDLTLAKDTATQVRPRRGPLPARLAPASRDGGAWELDQIAAAAGTAAVRALQGRTPLLTSCDVHLHDDGVVLLTAWHALR